MRIAEEADISAIHTGIFPAEQQLFLQDVPLKILFALLRLILQIHIPINGITTEIFIQVRIPLRNALLRLLRQQILFQFTFSSNRAVTSG